jgi:hypothetical protein
MSTNGLGATRATSFCKPGHEIIGSGIGRVVEETPTFVIMVKLGEAGAIATERDPRPQPVRRIDTD